MVTALALNDLYELGLSAGAGGRLRSAPRTPSSVCPAGSWTRRLRPAASRATRCTSTPATSRPRQIPFDLAAQGLRLLVVDTRVKHALGDGALRGAAGCEEGARILGVPALRDVPYEQLPRALSQLTDPTVRACVRHVVSENHRVERTLALLEAGDLRAIGPVLTEGHVSLRDDLQVSCEELDLAVESAHAGGALGARMTGGGFGGSAIVLVDASHAGTVTKSVAEAFAAVGHTEPRVFPATPSAGSRRVS